MAAQQKKEVVFGSPTYFALCGLGGILSCGLTHAAVTPVDMVKCNAQSNPAKFNKGLFGNMALISKSARGSAGLVRGWTPTLVGYSFQGLGKFGLYEVFKFKGAKLLGEENAAKFKTPLYMVSSASAEFFADILLCPWETVKLKVQTHDINKWLAGESEGYAKGVTDGLPKLLKTEGVSGAFGILGALWARQIPYTVIKFVAFEAIIARVYKYTTSAWKRPKESFNKMEQLGFTFGAGYGAGVICGAVSHPADMMASLLSKSEVREMPGGIVDKVKTLYTKGHGNIPATGFAGLWKGFGPRVLMIGTLTGLQWFIYDTVKVTFGIPTTGGAPKAKAE